MKRTPKIITTTLLFAFLFTVLSAQDFSWEIVYPFPNYTILVDGNFEHASNMLVVGYEGTILRSTDGGLEWEKQDAGLMENLLFLDAVPGSNGQEFLAASKTTIYHSVDGGQTWTDVAAPLGQENIQMMKAITSEMAYATNSDGEWLWSEDGGLSWELSSDQIPSSFIRDFSFIDANQGWALSPNGDVYHTTDGGLTWDLLSITPNEKGQTIFFVDANTGYISTFLGHLYKTENGGQSWTDHAIDGFPYSPEELVVVDENMMYAISSSGTKLYISSDGGLNWDDKLIVDYVYNDFVSLDVLDDGTIWTVGDYQTIAISENQGDSWTDVFDAYKANLSFVEFRDSALGFAGGAGYELLQSENAGNEWSYASNEGPIMSDFAIGASGNMYYARGYSGVFHSTNAGQSWTNVLSGVSFVRTLDVGPTGVVYASSALADYLIHRSEDNGATWTSQDSPDDTDVHGFVFLSESEILAWGASKMLRSEDGGISWEPYSPPSSTDIITMHFFDGMTGFLVTQYALFKTADGGDTWTELSPIGGTIRDLYFENEQHGWAVGGIGKEGYIYETNDGGESWELVRSTLYILEAIQTVGNAADELIVVGDGGIILRYSKEEFPTAVKEPMQPQALLLFPNPGVDSFCVQGDFEEGVIQVFDLEGRLMLRQVLEQVQDPMVRVSDLPAGQYLIVVWEGEQARSMLWTKV
jgi:photosystem II stability/assembly factor-like uncharacterized protein